MEGDGGREGDGERKEEQVNEKGEVKGTSIYIHVHIEEPL